MSPFDRAQGDKFSEDFWVRVVQIFVGLFFLGAAMFKVTIYFGHHARALTDDFAYWTRNGWPLHAYRVLMEWLFSVPHVTGVLEVLTILLQAIPGFMLVTNIKPRLAGAALFLFQINIFLGTFHQTGFNEFVGMSLWIALFFALRPQNETWNHKLWHAMTLLVFLFTLLFLYNRYLQDDPWPSGYLWQRTHLQQDVMSTALWWKRMVLWISRGTIGEILWTSVWWVDLLFCFLLLTRWRLQAGAVLLAFAILRSLTWMNSITSQGVLTVLFLFLWMSQEEVMQRKPST
ncbi:hypothetical protein HY285_00940 [Candidatus Peregrinibacteria bacterium]|nr:hypothetical protein [Candidatus Peregrinibacteria bacterium]MBI3816092.1 hypothetical protein [Candidatus Peregrinibacteria bacterium]